MDPSILPGFGTTCLQCDLRLTHCAYFIQFVNSADNEGFSECADIVDNTFYDAIVMFCISALDPHHSSLDRQQPTHVRLAGRVAPAGTISPRWQCAAKRMFSQGVTYSVVTESQRIGAQFA